VLGDFDEEEGSEAELEVVHLAEHLAGENPLEASLQVLQLHPQLHPPLHPQLQREQHHSGKRSREQDL